MSPDEFERACLTNNKKLSDAFNGDLKSYQTKHKPVLPRPSTIYDKKFHFMEETLKEREQRRRIRRENKLKAERQQLLDKEEIKASE